MTPIHTRKLLVLNFGCEEDDRDSRDREQDRFCTTQLPVLCISPAVDDDDHRASQQPTSHEDGDGDDDDDDGRRRCDGATNENENKNKTLRENSRSRFGGGGESAVIAILRTNTAANAISRFHAMQGCAAVMDAVVG